MNSKIFDWVFVPLILAVLVTVIVAAGAFVMNAVYWIGQILVPGGVGLLISLWIFLAWSKSDESARGSTPG